ncbi:MAG: GNAT family N-acetyltransferase [Dehalococcoidia bacterium]
MIAAHLIKGRKVVIRPKRISDASNDYIWRRDEELTRLDAAQMVRMPFSSFLLDYHDEISHESPRRRRFGIDTLDGQHIGNCMIYNIDTRKKEAEIGIMIGDRDYWDNGYGVDAVNTLVEHAFKTLNIDRIYLNTLEWNLRAQRCFRKCGFAPFKKQKRFSNTFIAMELLRDDWEKRESRNAENESPGNQDIAPGE